MSRIERTNEKYQRATAKAELPDPDEKASSWFCDPCKVEVYERRCPHCGKLERERC